MLRVIFWGLKISKVKQKQEIKEVLNYFILCLVGVPPTF